MSDDRELSALYHSADKPQPPTALDASIRSSAHQATKPERSHSPQWLGGIAASLFAVLLMTQLLPTVEQEVGVAPSPGDAPHPAMEAVVPGREIKVERARVSKQQAPEKALARDEADAALSPETALKTITALLDAGKTREAEQRLEDFHKRYPGITIPETITRRISK